MPLTVHPPRNLQTTDTAAVHAELLNDPTGVGYATMDATQRALALSQRPLVANPQPAPQVPQPLSLAALMSQLSDQAVTAINQSPLSARIGPMLDADDRAGLAALAGLWRRTGALSQAEHDAMQAAIAATVDDPTHPAQVRGPNRLSVVLGREVGGITAAEVAAIVAS